MSQLSVRINQKFDTYANWMQSTLVLHAGEIAVASIPTPTSDTGLTPPAIGIKVGDGTKKFSELAWIQATAGDVHSWAKASTKPTYQANEIVGLDDFINNEIQDTNTTYQFSFVDDVITIKSKEIGEEEFSAYATINLSGKADKVVGGVAGNLLQMDSNGNLVDSGAKIGDYALVTDLNSAKDRIQSLETKVGEETVSKQISDAVTAHANTAAATYATQAALQTLETAVNDMNTNLGERIDGNADDISAINNKIGVVGEGKTVVGMIEEVKSEANSANSALAEKVTANEKAIAAEKARMDAFMALEDGQTLDQALDTLKELQDFITSEASAADQMVLDIAANRTAIEGHTEDIAALEAVALSAEKKAIVDTLTDERLAAWDAAQVNVIEQIDGVTATIANKKATVTAVPVTLLQNVEGDTLVFNCGTATTVI